MAASNADETKVYLNFPLDALKVIQEISLRQCEGRFFHEPSGSRQPCTTVNPCLTCRARKSVRNMDIIYSRRSFK